MRPTMIVFKNVGECLFGQRRSRVQFDRSPSLGARCLAQPRSEKDLGNLQMVNRLLGMKCDQLTIRLQCFTNFALVDERLADLAQSK